MTDRRVQKKAFKKGDIIVYAVLAVLIAVLFTVTLTVNAQKKEYTGFTVSSYGKLVMTGDFSSATYKILDSAVVKTGENTFSVVCKDGFNQITVDWQNKTLKVTDTDCGTSKECTLMNFNNGIIICAPHNLTIRAVGKIPEPEVG